MDDWSGLEVIDPTLVKALKAYFPTAYQVSTAFDDLDGAGSWWMKLWEIATERHVERPSLEQC